MRATDGVDAQAPRVRALISMMQRAASTDHKCIILRAYLCRHPADDAFTLINLCVAEHAVSDSECVELLKLLIGEVTAREKGSPQTPVLLLAELRAAREERWQEQAS